MNLQELKKLREDKTSELMKTNGLFWAFSNKQFEENKTPLKEGEKYAAIGAGGYLPSGNKAALLSGLDEIDKWFKSEVKANKLRRENIKYALSNHECYYTGDCSDALLSLGEDYTLDEVREVYLKERSKQEAY